jgi:hypothetical protein
VLSRICFISSPFGERRCTLAPRRRGRTAARCATGCGRPSAQRMGSSPPTGATGEAGGVPASASPRAPVGTLALPWATSCIGWRQAHVQQGSPTVAPVAQATQGGTVTSGTWNVSTCQATAIACVPSAYRGPTDFASRSCRPAGSPPSQMGGTIISTANIAGRQFERQITQHSCDMKHILCWRPLVSPLSSCRRNRSQT